MRRRRSPPLRTLRVILAAIAMSLGIPGALFLRSIWFPPTFAVKSVATEPWYRDPALLSRALESPSAATYLESFVHQPNGSMSGPASLANVQRSFGDASATPRSVIKGTGRCAFLGLCLGGLSLDDLALLTRRLAAPRGAAPGTRRATVLRGLSLPALRDELRHVNDPDRRYVAHLQRGLLFGRGSGHYVALAAYLEGSDLTLVLDPDPEQPPFLVSSQRLWQALDATDPSKGQKRGLLRIE